MVTCVVRRRIPRVQVGDCVAEKSSGALFASVCGESQKRCTLEVCVRENNQRYVCLSMVVGQDDAFLARGFFLLLFSQMETESETQMDQCMVCLASLTEEHVWTCGCCHKRCHLLCVFQWTLRLSLNRSSRTITSFSCPGCRTDHPISGLPGFTQQTQQTQPTRSGRSGRAGTRSLSTNTAANVTVTVSREEEDEEGEDLENTEEEDEYESEDDETYDEDDDDFIDDDELDEDEEDDDDEDRGVSSVSTGDIYIEVGQLTINFTR